MKKLLRIIVKGETLIVHGRVVRTPVDIKLSEAEFYNIELQLKSKGITNEYYFWNSIETKRKSTLISKSSHKIKETVVEKLEIPQEDLTYLERLANT